jgi:hypothetical protein
MTKTLTQLVDDYIGLLRDLINAKVSQYETYRERSFSVFVKEELKLRNEDDWNFLCASMDLVGDTNLAIQNFVRFQLDGPTRYEEIGEKYLRLYGFLNAVYMQQDAILALHRILNCHDENKVKDRIYNLDIRDIRNKLASHTLNYIDKREKGKKTPLFVVRVGLEGSRVSYSKGSRSRGKFEDEDIVPLLRDHLKVIVNALDGIVSHAIASIWEKNKREKRRFEVILEELREEKAGHIILKMGKGTKIIIKTYGELKP